MHNGIIENFRELRDRLAANGCTFTSDTDTEVVAHLVTEELKSGKTPAEAVAAALKQLRGAFALAFLFAGEDDLLIAARKGSPLAIGYGDGEMYLGSDAIALAPFTDTISYLEEGDWAVLTRQGAQVFDEEDRPLKRPLIKSAASGLLIDKGNFRHFMAKEIHEQPEVVGHTLAHYIDMTTERIVLPADTAVRLAAAQAPVDLPPAAPPSMPAWWRNTGSSASPSCRWRSISPRNSAIARRRWTPAISPLHLAVRRDGRHAGEPALRQGA